MKNIFVFLIGVFLFSCNSSECGYVKVVSNRIVDGQGRQLILRGLNVVNKDSSQGYLFNINADDYKSLKKKGYNSLRLGVIWAGLEPKPMEFDEEYLKRLDHEIDKAAEAGLFVILDMHQDLYGVKFGDGAPRWATIDNGANDVTDVNVWSERYFLSEAIHKSFDNFWANIPAEDGVGLQDHYAQAWQIVAERYKDNKAVIGFDLMNEPFIGSDITQGFMAMMHEYAITIKGEDETLLQSIDRVSEMWLDPAGRVEVTNGMNNDIAVYKRIMHAASHVYSRFESEKLSPMYQRVADKIREVNSNHIIFIEPSITSNNGVYSGIVPVKGFDGIKDPQQVFMPHVYDIVTDTDISHEASFDRLGYIFESLNKKAEEMRMPMLIGEWGAFYGNEKCKPIASQIKSTMDRYKVGDFYWSYPDNMAYEPEFITPIPVAVSGVINGYKNIISERIFVCSWKYDKSGNESMFFIPDIENVKKIEGVQNYTIDAKKSLLVVKNKGSDNIIKMTVKY